MYSHLQLELSHFKTEYLGIKSFQKKKNKIVNFFDTEADVRRCSVKKMLMKISRKSQENTCVRVSF